MPGKEINEKTMESESRGGKKMKGRYTLLGLAAAATIVITAALVIIIPEKGPEGPGSGARMTVLFAIGDVSVKRGETGFRKLSPRENLNREDLVRTGENSTVVLQISGRGILRISRKSIVRLSGLSMKSVELSLKKGGIFSKLEKLKKGDKFQVTTPTYVASVRGTEFLVEQRQGKPAGVQVLQGKVAVEKKGTTGKIILAGGEGTKQGGKPGKRKLTLKEKLILKKYSLYAPVDSPEEKTHEEMKAIFSNIKERETEIDKMIRKETSSREKISPLDRLRRAGKPLTMIYLRDGSQITGSRVSSTAKTLLFDTGEGVIRIPTAEILRSVPVK